MRNIPLFTTEHGIANLLLKNVTHSGSAYIQLLSVNEYASFLQECCDFCRMVGAEKIYVTGDERLKGLPLYTQILAMSCPGICSSESDCTLVPVTGETSESWRELYNRHMLEVPAVDYMSKSDMAAHISREDSYYVFRDDDLLGLGIAAGDRIDAVVSLKPRSGMAVLTALYGALTSRPIRLKVASNNVRALALYEKMGFRVNNILEEWFDATNFVSLSRNNT